MAYQIRALSTPIPVRPYVDDNEVIKQLSEIEDRPQSVIIRTLLHEAICKRLGITDPVRVPLIGTIGKLGSYNGHTVIDPENQIELRQAGTE